MEKLLIDHEEQNQVTLVRLQGALDTETADAFDQYLSDLIQQKHNAFLIDLQGVDYISSAGIGVLVGCLNQLQDQDGQFKLAHVSARVARALSMLSLLDLFETFDSIEEALTSF
ncbi:MAG: STAS domain-containing protein [Myxococcales bacterium]|nr:STAS domain-containing protein [Myxococcales bacterium]